MDAKCYITSCDVLDLGSGIVNELAYGINCEVAKYCYFAQYYIEYDLQDLKIICEDEDTFCIVNPIENPIDIPVITDPINPPIIEGINNVYFEYANYVCQLINEIEISTTTTSTTTSTTTTIDCFVDFNLWSEDDIIITTTTTSTTSTTSTTLEQLETCNVQVDILEITW